MKRYKKVILLLLIILLSIILTACTGGHDVEKARAKIKDYLYKKYGEEFVVDRIGTRNGDGITEYVARIYPKSIIGTHKEGDRYYYGSASIDKRAFGRLEKPGDNYGLIQINMGAEKYLMPKAKEIFGNRVLLKTEVKYKKRQDDGFYVWYKEPSFQKAMKELKTHPNKKRIELSLQVYIFDRIQDKAEKEKRRQQIFDFVQYLKDEGLFEYLELGVAFIDERVLAPSYREYSSKVYFSDKEEVVVQGETVDLPPMELRKNMSKVLQKEVDRMSEEDLLENMREIRKSELGYDGIGKNNTIYFNEIYSPGILKEKYSTSLRKNPEIKRFYEKVDDVKIRKNLEYVYTN